MGITHPPSNTVVLEPRRSRLSSWALVGALLLADLITIPALLTARQATSEANKVNVETRCRAEVSTGAMATILEQQDIITTGLRQVVAGTETFDRDVFIARADTASIIAKPIIDALKHSVETCKITAGG